MIVLIFYNVTYFLELLAKKYRVICNCINTLNYRSCDPRPGCSRNYKTITNFAPVGYLKTLLEEDHTSLQNH